MRDVLIHDYMGVDLKTVWMVSQERLTELKLLMDELSNKFPGIPLRHPGNHRLQGL